MAVDVVPASLMLRPNAHIYIRGAGLGHAGLDRTVHSLAGFDQRSQTHAAVINNLGATELRIRLVAPSALAPLFSLAGHGHRLACLPIDLPNYDFLVTMR